MKILITGISGFIGQNLARTLSASGHEVIGMDLTVASHALSVEMVQGNLVTQEGFDRIPWNTLDTVYHLASAGVKPDSRQWPLCVEVNIKGTLNLLGAVEHAGSCPTLIYTHSFYEDALETNPSLRENPYILTKSIATAAVGNFSTRYSGRVVDLSIFQVYGPGDSPATVLPYICTQLLKGENAVLGSGTGLRDWIYVDDVVAGLVSAMSAGVCGRVNRYDAGNGCFVSIREMAERLASLFGMKNHLVFNPEKDRPDTDLEVCASRFIPGWQGRTSVDKGLEALVKHYQAGE